MAINAELRVKLSAVQTQSGDLGNPEFRPLLEYLTQFTSGSGADQIETMWTDERTINASSSENLDLAGVLSDAFGTVLTLAEIVAIVIEADEDNVNDVVVGNHATAAVVFLGAAAHTISIKPGGIFALAGPNAAGIATVTPTTADMLKVANSGAGTPVTYKIAILARI